MLSHKNYDISIAAHLNWSCFLIKHVLQVTNFEGTSKEKLVDTLLKLVPWNLTRVFP